MLSIIIIIIGIIVGVVSWCSSSCNWKKSTKCITMVLYIDYLSLLLFVSVLFFLTTLTITYITTINKTTSEVHNTTITIKAGTFLMLSTQFLLSQVQYIWLIHILYKLMILMVVCILSFNKTMFKWKEYTEKVCTINSK